MSAPAGQHRDAVVPRPRAGDDRVLARQAAVRDLVGAPSRPAPGTARRAWPLLREAALLVTLLGIYTGARMLAGQDVGLAFDNARRVLDVETWLHLPSERHLQVALLAYRPLARAASTYYAAAHLPVTALALVWLFLRRPAHYLWARRALVLSTLVALGAYLLLPTAPPRMLTGLGFVDVPALLGQSVYGPATTSSLTDQYAAMPSLHVGWSVLVATACITASTGRRRWLWLLHPVVTVFVVVSTGNHYWLDGLIGASIVTVALLVAQPRPRAAA